MSDLERTPDTAQNCIRCTTPLYPGLMSTPTEDSPQILPWDAEGRPPTIAEWAAHLAAAAPPLTSDQRTTLRSVFAGSRAAEDGAA